MRHRSLILLAATLYVGCASSLPAGEAMPPVDVDALKESLFQTDVAFSEYSEQNGAKAAFDRYLDDDALQLPAGAQPVFGRQTIVSKMGSGYTLVWQPVGVEVASSGDLGYTWGRYQLHFTAEDGTEQTEHGKYLNVWRRHPDATWKVLVDTGNANPDPNL